MVKMIGFDSRWWPIANPQQLQHYYHLSMSRWNDDNEEPIKSNRWNQTNCFKIIRDQGQNSKGLIDPVQGRSRPISFKVSLCPLKTLVRNLIFKTSPFVLSRLYKTLFGHLLIRLFNYACLLIQTLQMTSNLDLMSSEFERLFLTSSHYGLGSYVLSL